MKRAIFLALLSLATTSAFAQTPSVPPLSLAQNQPSDGVPPDGPAPGGPRPGQDWGAPPPPPPPHGPHGRAEGPPPPPPPKGAFFRFAQTPNGTALAEVKCADDEPIKVCADVAMSLMDKLNASKH